MTEFKEIKEGKKYKLVPPDGGWGYLIWVAVIITNVSTKCNPFKNTVGIV